MNCPSCQIKIPRDAINIQKDIAQCQNCETIFSISDSINNLKNDSFHNKSIDENFDINNPPKGAYINHLPNGVQIGATTRSWFALFIVPFALIWSGFSLGGIYGSQILSGEFNILISLFGIPFLFGSLFIWGMALMTTFGKIEVTLDDKGGHIFTGVGKIGQNKRFLWSEINNVREEISVSNSNKGGRSTHYYISLEGQKKVRFGNFLPSEKRYYILKTLEQIVQNRK